MPQTDIRRRSRTGCRACRHQHRKCDEQRPKCSSCRLRGVECDYQRPLKWTGLCNSETFSQQNPTAPCTSSDLPIGESAASSPALPLQYEFEVADWLLAHTSGGSTDPHLDIDPPGSQTYHHTSPPAHDQDDSAVQGHFNSSSEEFETVNGNLLDDNNESGFSEQPLTKSTETSETTAASSFLGDSETGAINNILMGTLLSQVFESSNDEMTFAYYLNRVSSCTTAYDSDRNPYRKLAVTALSYPVLLHGVLSVSTAHMEMFGRSSRCTLYSRQSQALRSLSAALNSLHLQNERGGTSECPLDLDGVFLFHSPKEVTLAAMIMQTFSVLMVELDSIETHMTYALYLIQHLGCFKKPPRSVFMRTLIYRFAMVDVMLAFIQSRHPQASPDFFMYQNNIDQLINDEEPSFRDMHGCHQRVLSFLAQIAILSAHIAESGSPRSEIQVKGYNLETEMRLWGRSYYGGMAAATSSDPPIGGSRRQFNNRADLEIVCECFYWTAHILLLRRVFLDNTESSRVQLICKYLFRLMDSLVSGCGPDSSLPFPFYIAACEAITTDDQNWVRKKHGEMLAAYRDPAREALMASVERIWAISKTEATTV